MKIGFIGSGRVGQIFGKYLYDKNFNVAGYTSRTMVSAQAGAALVSGKAYLTIEELIQEADLILITTPDNAIEETAGLIADMPAKIENKLFVHMSGALRSTIMGNIIEKHPNNWLYALHPLQAFVHVTKGVQDLAHTVFTIEGPDERIQVLEDMLKSCGNEYFILKQEQKELYHGAACVASNYLVTLVDLALDLMGAAGIEAQGAYRALWPLIQGTLKNIEQMGTKKAITGPIARGDNHTLEKHLQAIGDQLPSALSLYQSLGKATVRLAAHEKLQDNDKLDQINLIWKEGVE